MRVRCRFYTFLIFIFCIQAGPSLNAQSSVPDVIFAFKAISAEPQILHLKKNHIHTPSGGHLQGIQFLADSTFIITGSSASYSYYITADQTHLISTKKISDSPYRHAGGCQVYDHSITVGIEDNQAKDKSEIMMILFDGHGQEIGRRVVAHRSGTVKRSTAGATGYTQTANGTKLIAVGDWDSRNIDFYYSAGDSMVMLDSPAMPIVQHWCSYQSINLLTDTNGKIYLIGFGLDGTADRADLFEVKLEAHTAKLSLIATRNFKCKGASFRYGAGLGITHDHKLAIYSCSRNAGANTAINIFR